MKKAILIFFILTMMASIPSSAQLIQTLTYYHTDTTQLDLDLYLPENHGSKKTPLVLFAFGGGFSTGNKSDGKNFAAFLAKNGFAVACISYTLYMKDKDFGCGGTLTEKIKAIRLGVSDMWQATAYLIQNANTYHLDTSKFFISGISAGAEISFHACFWDYPLMNLFSNNLPANFRYAGLIGGSGAIMDINLITAKNAIPMLLSHGNMDVTVPYAAGSHRSCKTNASGWLILFGSKAVYDQMNRLHKNIRMITFDKGGHEFSGYLFEKKPEYVLQFLKEVSQRKKFNQHIMIPPVKNALKRN